MSKRTWIGLLACANLALLVGIVLATTSPKTAMAQGTGLSGNYLAVTGEIQDQYDALYLLDLKNFVLHGFWYDRGPRRLVYAHSRDLNRDFRANARN